MTNAQAAAHFAALPPEERAEIALINGDSATISFEELAPTTETVLGTIDTIGMDDREVAKALRLLHVWQQW